MFEQDKSLSFYFMAYRKIAEFFQQFTERATNPYHIALDDYSNQMD